MTNKYKHYQQVLYSTARNHNYVSSLGTSVFKTSWVAHTGSLRLGFK